MIDSGTLEAIEATDTDELLRVVDRHCAARDWDGLIELRSRCREAVSRGKQVWGIEEHIRYRLALEASPPYAGPIVSEGQARFALGPLPEVAASTKTFADMDPYLEDGPARDTFAAERVVRGEQVPVAIPDLPSALLPWEPSYALATYKPDKVETPAPIATVVDDATLPDDAQPIDDFAATGALADLVEPWTDQSNGRCQTVAVAGDHLTAVKALGVPQARVGEMKAGEALAWMAWAAASGGAHGRRRGAAAGRYLAWWAVAGLADLDWPADAERVGGAMERMRWFWFDDGSPDVGWALRLAIFDPVEDLGWAVSASDMAD